MFPSHPATSICNSCHIVRNICWNVLAIFIADTDYRAFCQLKTDSWKYQAVDYPLKMGRLSLSLSLQSPE